MNIAQSIKSRYESEDFKSNYAINLLEDKSAVEFRIKQIVQHEYNFERRYGYNMILTDEQCEKVYNYILENIEEFTSDFNSYYVGDTSIDSVSFGEQCEQLEGLINHKTNKPYKTSYLKEVFENEDFYVSKGYAYYDLSDSGVHIDLLNSEIPILEELKKELQTVKQ